MEIYDNNMGGWYLQIDSDDDIKYILDTLLTEYTQHNLLTPLDLPPCVQRLWAIQHNEDE